jgi:NTP-dependent ternary system trypsin peptidase co-occuring protein
MDTVLLRVPLGDDSDSVVEVQVSRRDLVADADGVVLASGDGGRFQAVGFTLASAMDRVVPALKVILDRLREGIHAPEEVTMEVGLEIGGETGIIFAKGTTTATVAVSMTWRRGEQPLT